MTAQTTVSAQSGGDDDATRPLSASLIGSVIDERYRVESILGVGGVGVVYGAQRVDLEMGVALKVLRSGVESLPLVLKRFEREAKVLASLSHPHIVGLTDYGVHEGTPYLVMERLEGESLEEHVLSEGPLLPERAMEVFRAVLRGLAYAHEHSVLHRDLKPGNIFLQTLSDEPAHIKLLDFGLAKIVHPGAEPENKPNDPTVTRAGTILGTPAYMAPEQASGGRVDARADVYAAGVLLFELLTGSQPFVADRRTDLLAKHLLEPVPDPNAIRRGLRVGDELGDFLLRSMAKDPGGRFADAREMLVAFDALPAESLTYQAPSDPEVTREFPVSPTYLEDRGQQSESDSAMGRWLGVGVAVVVGLLGLGLWLSQGSQPSNEPAPSRPGSAEAAAVDPAAVDPVAVDPAAVDPAAVDPVAVDPAAVDPAAVDPAAVDPAAVDAVAVDPVAVDPVAVDPAEIPELVARDEALRERSTRGDEATNSLPAELQELLERLQASDGVDRDAHRAVRLYQRLHPDDPRPSLILAANLADHESWSGAVERYAMIFERWPNAADEERVARDLVAAALRSRSEDAAISLLAQLDATRVAEEIDALRAQSENRARRAALASLRRRFSP